MDWELYERYRSTLLLAGLLFLSALLLAFHRSTSVRHIQTFLVRLALPPQKFLVQEAPSSISMDSQNTVEAPGEASVPPEPAGLLGEQKRKIEILEEENIRLLALLDLKKSKWPRALAAHVVGRDPQRWFQEIVLDKGKEDGIGIDYSVVAEAGGREALVGRVVDVSGRVSKVMLIQDPLSAVAAVVSGAGGEDGVVEGTNSHELILKYLDRGSQVKIGDLVVTSGLGNIFPPGVPIGWVQNLAPDARQMFLEAKLSPYFRSNALRSVLVLEPHRGPE